MGYSQYRPEYPVDLFRYLATLTANQECVWDCASGTGQAARGLAPYFDTVIATDASDEQVANAYGPDNVEFAVANATASGLTAGTVDLVVVAQALHWFDLQKFYSEVKRVLKNKGVIAVWCYSLHRISPQIDVIIDDLYTNIVGSYWPPERRLVESGYRDLDFPFEGIVSPQFEMQAQWSLQQLTGYLETWSATQRYIAHKGESPVPDITDRLLGVWDPPDKKRTVNWPLACRVGVLHH